MDHKSYYDALVTRDAIPSRHLLTGDSLTAGYGVDGINGISIPTADKDTKLMAYQAAEMLYADSRINGIIVGMGYYPAGLPRSRDTPYTKNILPEIFPYIQNEVPDLIVCNLGTNDASYVRQIPSRERAFVEKYTDFIQQLKLLLMRKCFCFMV